MSSAPRVNYAVRPNKAIQRKLVFDALRSALLGVRDDLVYVGLGAFWFTDFVIAQHALAPRRMVSIERDRGSYERALFNRPFAHVDVEHGDTEVVLPRLLQTRWLRTSFPVFWLDYDGRYTPDVERDIQAVVQSPSNSLALLVTFAADPKRYGKQARLASVLRELFPHLDLPEVLPPDDLPDRIADSVLDTICAFNAQSASGRTFVPAFRILYRDSTSMATVGGFLIPDDSSDSQDLMCAASRCRPRGVVSVPLLTLREFFALRSGLPSSSDSAPAQTETLAPPLCSDDLSAFEQYYLDYPSYLQVQP